MFANHFLKIILAIESVLLKPNPPSHWNQETTQTIMLPGGSERTLGAPLVLEDTLGHLLGSRSDRVQLAMWALPAPVPHCSPSMSSSRPGQLQPRTPGPEAYRGTLGFQASTEKSLGRPGEFSPDF